MATVGRRQFGMSGEAADDDTGPSAAQPPEEVNAPVWDAASEVDMGAQLAEGRIAEGHDALSRDLGALEPVKTRIEEIASLTVLHRLSHGLGLESERPSPHMCYSGRPSTRTPTATRRSAATPQPASGRAPRPGGAPRGPRPEAAARAGVWQKRAS
mgnify:CR=1 FL=1